MNALRFTLIMGVYPYKEITANSKTGAGIRKAPPTRVYMMSLTLIISWM